MPLYFYYCAGAHRDLHSFPTRRSSDLDFIQRSSASAALDSQCVECNQSTIAAFLRDPTGFLSMEKRRLSLLRSEGHTSELQSPDHLVCRLLLEKIKKQKSPTRKLSGRV